MMRLWIKKQCKMRRISPFVILPFLFFPSSLIFPLILGIIVFTISNFHNYLVAILSYSILSCIFILVYTISYVKGNLYSENKNRKNNLSPFLKFMLLILYSIASSAILIGIVSFVWHLFHKDYFSVCLLAYSLVFCFMKFFAFSFSIPCHGLLKNIIKSDEYTEDVILNHTNPFIGFYGCFYDDLRLLFQEEKVRCQELYFRPINRPIRSAEFNYNHDDYICVTFTPEKLICLKELYVIEASKKTISIEYHFSEDTPISITYNRNTHTLKKIGPANNYEYTYEQLAAIEKFNMLYP